MASSEPKTKIEEYICISEKEVSDSDLRKLYKKLNCTVVVEGQVEGQVEGIGKWNYTMEKKYDSKDNEVLSQFGLEKCVD